MNDYKHLSARIKNCPQAQYYIDCGCIVKKWDRDYDSEKEKAIWYVRFLLDDKYKEAKDTWMKNRKQ